VLARTHLRAVRGLKVIEIGRGRGGFAKYLVAADFSEKAVEIARRRLAGSPNCEILVADIQDIPFSPETFDWSSVSRRSSTFPIQIGRSQSSYEWRR
jgi:ubiquinone/menaquinone biosynthesis C-methylase UbiE